MKNLSQEEMKKIISDVVSDYKKNNDIITQKKKSNLKDKISEAAHFKNEKDGENGWS